MRAGELNEIIVVEQPVKEENELGEVVECIWAKKYSTKAQVIYKSGIRSDDNYNIHNEYGVQFVIRIYHSINEADRILFHGKYYRIESIEYSREYQMIKINASLIND